MPKRVTSGGTHLRGLAPVQHSSEEILQRLRAIGDTVSVLTDPEFEPQTFGTDRNVLITTFSNKLISSILFFFN